MPIPELVPVIRTDAMGSLLLCEQPENRKTKPATWVSHSAGFAIGSPRGLGEPLDIASRGSWHLSCLAICVRDRASQRRREALWPRGAPAPIMDLSPPAS